MSLSFSSMFSSEFEFLSLSLGAVLLAEWVLSGKQIAIAEFFHAAGFLKDLGSCK